MNAIPRRSPSNDAWEQLLDAVEKARQDGLKVMPRPLPPTRLYEDDLRTYLAKHLPWPVRTPATTSKAPDIVWGEDFGIQMKLSLAVPLAARLALTKAVEDFSWFLGSASRPWTAGPRTLVFFWSGQSQYRRVKVFNHCVKTDKVNGPPYDKKYTQRQIEPLLGFVRQDDAKALVFRTDLKDGAIVSVEGASYRYEVRCVGGPADGLWATCYRHLGDADASGPSVRLEPEQLLSALGAP